MFTIRWQTRTVYFRSILSQDQIYLQSTNYHLLLNASSRWKATATNCIRIKNATASIPPFVSVSRAFADDTFPVNAPSNRTIPLGNQRHIKLNWRTSLGIRRKRLVKAFKNWYCAVIYHLWYNINNLLIAVKFPLLRLPFAAGEKVRSN